MAHGSMSKQHMVCGVIVVVALVVGFGGGMYYGKSSTPTRAGAFGAPGGAGGTGNRARMMGNGFTAGTISSKDANSITVTLQGGSNSANGNSSGSRIVLYSGTTQIAKSTSGTADDLTVGQSVTVSGTPNSDGSITAQMIQLRPAGSQGIGGRGGAQTGPPSAPVNQ